MPNDSSENSSVDGEALQSLPEPGTPSGSNFTTEPVEGIQSPPHSVANTPTASGRTPAEEANASTVSAEETVRRASVEAARTVNVRVGHAPHYFQEQIHQVFYHDAIVYIEGEDVSPFLSGSLSVSYGLGSDSNTCEFSLDNAGHRFTITPENLKREFRMASPIEQFGPIDYDETAKRNIYERKSSEAHNPVDPDSGGRRFPLHLWSSVFHKYDCVRVWIHNPNTERDEWIPAFTGFITSKPISEDYIKARNKITVSCKDIRCLMELMRVNSNTMLTVLQDGASDPTNSNSLTSVQVFGTAAAEVASQFSETANRSGSQSFFRDLIRGSSFDNPWTSLSLPELIASLTFLPDNASLVQNSDRRANSRPNNRSRELLLQAARRIRPLQAKVSQSDRGVDVLTAAERTQYNAFLQQLTTNSATVGDVSNILNGTYFESPSQQQSNDAAVQQQTSPGAGGDAEQHRTVGQSQGSGRVGRMRPGVFPYKDSLFGDPTRPYWDETYFPPTTTTSSHDTGYYQAVSSHMKEWYNLCFFGSPVRTNLREVDPNATEIVSDASPDNSSNNRRYWTEAEARAAGSRTRREAAWSPDAQSVHFLSPGESTPSDILWALKTVAGTTPASNPNWDNRLKIIAEACKTADYRFWVSGVGDLIFEFAQYDFSPKDYGPWEDVLTLNHHLKSETMDDEGGPIKTAVVAVGSLTGHGSVDETGAVAMNPINKVGVWSPNLASRLGISVATRSYPQITDVNRLEQVATLEFQKLLASADKYSLTLAFRPWVLLNRPIYNSYRSRYALVDGIKWTYPVTAGELAGHTAPTMSLSLNYTRSVDEVGIPRYITGGPSNAMYFAHPANESATRDLLTATTSRVDDFTEALHSLETAGAPTSAQLRGLQERYRAIAPSGQTSFNVISALLLSAGSEEPGETDARLALLQRIEASISDLINHPGSFTDSELQVRLQELRADSARLRRSLREDSPNGTYADQTSAGTRPRFGSSGVRSTLGPAQDVVLGQNPSSSSSDNVIDECTQSEGGMFSSPLGAAPAERRSRSGSSIQEFSGEFPRYTAGRYDLRGGRGFKQWHRGVDFYTAAGEPVYCVQDGVVVSVGDQFAPVTSSGRFAGQRRLDPQTAIYILHKDGFISIYRHLDPGSIPATIVAGAVIPRHANIGAVGNSGAERLFKPTHLHFETGIVEGSSAFENWVGDEKRFSIIRNRARIRIGARTRKDLERLPSSVVSDSDRGSMRVMYTAHLTGTEISEAVKSTLGLNFLGRRNRLRGNTILTYSPLTQKYPFSRAHSSGAHAPTGRDKVLMTLQDYFAQFGLKGIPGLNELVQTGAGASTPVPAPISSGTPAQLRRNSRRIARATRLNTRSEARSASQRTKLDTQIALFSASMSPSDCPPGAIVQGGAGPIDISGDAAGVCQ